MQIFFRGKFWGGWIFLGGCWQRVRCENYPWGGELLFSCWLWLWPGREKITVAPAANEIGITPGQWRTPALSAFGRAKQFRGVWAN